MRGLITIFLVSVFANSQAQTTILQSDFNNGIPVGWQTINNDGLTPYNDPAVNWITDAWVLAEDEDSTGTGDSCLISTSWYDPAGTADDYLITPAITLGGAGNYLYFDIKALDQSYPDAMEIRASTGGVNIWEFFVDDKIYDTVAAPPYWSNFMVSLDSAGYTNQTIRLAFRNYTTDRFKLALDNIRVEINNPIGIEAPTLPTLTVALNPTEIFVANLNENTSFELFDLSGRMIESGMTNGSIAKPSSNGIYLLRLNGFAPAKISVH